MIREEELLEAIAECQGTKHPNANTCIKLASFYTILDHIAEKEEPPIRQNVLPEEKGYSFDEPQEKEYRSETEFGQLLKSKETYAVLQTIDELMETLRMIHPKLYNAFIGKLTAV